VKRTYRQPKKEPTVEVELFTDPEPIPLTFSDMDLVRSERGIRNIGNTCYLNAAIQCIVSSPPVMKYFCNSSINKQLNMDTSTNGRLVPLFSDLVCQLTRVVDNNNIPAIPSDKIKKFKSTFEEFAPQFEGTDQQDSSEFTTFLLDGLHMELNRNANKPFLIRNENFVNERSAFMDYQHNNDSFLVDLYINQLQRTLICVECEMVTIRYENAWSVNLPIPSGNKKLSLNDCLIEYNKQEFIKDDNAKNCERCNKKQTHTSTYAIMNPAKIMIVTLNRFKYDQRKNKRIKIVSPVTIPFETTIGGKQYSLYGVVIHEGSASGGHYTSYVKSLNKWYLYDDSRITEFNWDYISKDVEKNAYIMFYHMIE